MKNVDDTAYKKIVGQKPVYMVCQLCGKGCMYRYIQLKNCWKDVCQNIYNSYPQW